MELEVLLGDAEKKGEGIIWDRDKTKSEDKRVDRLSNLIKYQKAVIQEAKDALGVSDGGEAGGEVSDQAIADNLNNAPGATTPLTIDPTPTGAAGVVLGDNRSAAERMMMGTQPFIGTTSAADPVASTVADRIFPNLGNPFAPSDPDSTYYNPPLPASIPQTGNPARQQWRNVWEGLGTVNQAMRGAPWDTRP